MNENSEDTLVRYGIIAAVIIVALMAITMLSMLDFSGDEQNELSIEKTNNNANVIRNTVNIKRDTSNIEDDEDIKQDTSDIQDKSNIENIPEEKVSNEEIQELLTNMSSQDRLLTRERMEEIFSDGKYPGSYQYTYDNNHILKSFSSEVRCQTEEDMKNLYREFEGTVLEKCMMNSGLTVYIQYP